LSYGNFRINLAAGLEDTLILKLNPDWNLTGKSLIPIDINSEKPELTNDPQPITTLIPVTTTLEILLGQAYYNQGFFNVVREYSQMLGVDNATIEIQLGKDNNTIIQGYINRTANKNGTPRIMGGKEFRNWIRTQFKFNEMMKVDIISPIAIRVYRN